MSRATVIGAGAVGLCCAKALSDDGWIVTVLDRNPEGWENCSFGNAGMIAVSHFEPLASPGILRLALKLARQRDGPLGFHGPSLPRLAPYAARFLRKAWHGPDLDDIAAITNLSLLSQSEWQKLQEESQGAIGHERAGLLMVCSTEDSLSHEAETIGQARELGMAVELLKSPELQRLEPEANYLAAGAVYFPEDSAVTPPRAMRWLKDRTRAAGCVVNFDTGVQSLRELEDGSDLVVVAAGARSQDLARQVGARLLMEPGKGFGTTLAERPVTLRHGAILVDPRVALRLNLDGLRLTCGMVIGDRSPEPDMTRVQRAVRDACDVVGALQPCHFAGANWWSGQRPCPADGMPYIGYIGDMKKTIVATGHGMLGLTQAPGTARLVADLAAGRPPVMDMHRFDPART